MMLQKVFLSSAPDMALPALPFPFFDLSHPVTLGLRFSANAVRVSSSMKVTDSILVASTLPSKIISLSQRLDVCP